jgi:hypothetical protein
MKIASCAIHPAVGIARVGNSLTGYFIGPELPNRPVHPPGGFKDGPNGEAIKRQAARFRIFGFADDGSLIGELTSADAEIVWSVQLANKKAEWDTFAGMRGEDLPIAKRRPESEWRNKDLTEQARETLVIAPAIATLKVGEQHLFDDGEFMDVQVTLGEARVEQSGRLLVLGGFGRSETVEEGRRIVHYANNDRWFDDVADGPVFADVKLRDGTVLKAKPAWVVSAPPDFSPETIGPVTLFDVVTDTAIRHLGMPPPARPEFCAHIAPLIMRAGMAIWTSQSALDGHAKWLAHLNMTRLADASEAVKKDRQALLEKIRNPFATDDDAKAQANKKFMPALSGDSGDTEDGDPDTWLKLTHTQYTLLRQWADGDFVSDWPAGNRTSEEVTPTGLDRAALESCSGGAFYPGIEGGWMFRKPEAYEEPYRLNASLLKAGDLTKQMAVPWQADFFECNTAWWPAQRPDDVLPAAAFRRLRQIDRELANDKLGEKGSDKVVRDALEAERRTLVSRRVPWARHLPPHSPAGDNAMVRHWAELGFVTSELPDGSVAYIDGKRVLVESEVSELAQMDMSNLSEAFYRLVNIERFPEFRKSARELADWFLAQADFSDPHYKAFKYTTVAFRERMDWIYNDFVAEIDEPYWLEEFPREAVVENLRQKAPMNMIDGAWLHHILAAGPTSEVRAKLFSIWSDEAGNGQIELNHSNIYDTLLRSLDVYLPPVTSRGFVELDLLPSAWANPVFQLCMGLFPEDCLPELLGMTLYLEWEATPTMLPIARMLRKFNIDPQFYAMHAAIDNVTAGHGALARQAIELHLEGIQLRSGAVAVQNGYVTWATLGPFGSDLFELLTKMYKPDGSNVYARERMVELVRRKAPYASTAHGMAVLGDIPLGPLFADPEKLLDMLVAKRWVDPQHPRDSPFFTKLMSFHGPMYKVFTPAEQDAILDWIESLGNSAPGPTPGPVAPAERVRRVIEDLMDKAASESSHKKYKIKLADGREISVTDLFLTGDTLQIMKDLAQSDYVVKGDAAKSPLIEKVFDDLMAGVLSEEQESAFKEWINTGCPMPGAMREARLAVLALSASVKMDAAFSSELFHVPFATRRQFIGAGSVH